MNAASEIAKGIAEAVLAFFGVQVHRRVKTERRDVPPLPPKPGPSLVIVHKDGRIERK